MKKLRLMSMLVFVPIVLGMGLLIGGSLTDNETAYNIGGLVLTAGIPVTMFALVVVGLVLMMTGKLDLSDGKKSANCGKSKAEVKKNDDEWESVDDDESEWVEVEDDGDEVKDVGGGVDSISGGQKKKEYSRHSDTNTSRGYDNKIKQAEYISRQSGNRYKNSTTTQKVFGWLFFGFLMTDFFMIMVFAFIGIFVGAIVCFCLFGGTILIALLVTVLRQKISMGLGVSKKKKRDALDGKVLSCDVASTTTVNNRVTKVVYMVEITDGENEYSAYTEDYYDRGDDIKFCKIGKKLAMILDKEEFDDDEPLDL
ncbi:MAG: hypothetical protein K2M89_06940 [Clostridiales bacterium]|nr:hypothetical protein [Clostridiales bacterium]